MIGHSGETYICFTAMFTRIKINKKLWKIKKIFGENLNNGL